MEPEKRNIKETSSLSQSRKGPKTCYGATRNPESAADYKLVTHNLTLSDTLQGLAIKYGVTVEQIRRVNKLWTNDNILIFKTINIPVKLTYDSEGSTENTWKNDDNPGTSKDIKGHKPSTSKTKEYDSEESVDSGVHEVNLADINADVIGHSRIKSERHDRHEDASSNSESLNLFLKKMDGDMKAFIQREKKQRTNSVPGLIHNLQASHEEERSKRHRQTDSNHVRLKNSRMSRSRTHQSSQSLEEDSGSLDDLFEL